MRAGTGPVARGQRSAPGIDQVLAGARHSLRRVEPADLADAMAGGAFVIDIRPERARVAEGHLPGAVVIDRTVLEWRLDPTSGATMTGGPTRDRCVIVVCNEGYSSSLAARDLQAIGFVKATDLVGGFRAYAAAGHPIQPHPARVVE